MTYGSTHAEATAKAQALALRVLAERLEMGEVETRFVDVSFQAA